MKRLLVLTTLFLVPMLVPTAAAEPVAPRCTAPCGWINPIIDLNFPDKPDCGGALVLGAERDASDCLAPPMAGEPVSLEGSIRWYWDVTDEGTYPNDPTQDIVISFAGTNTNPTWIDFRVEPDSFTLTSADLASPAHYQIRENSATDAQLFFWYEQDITITFERTGDPEGEELSRLREQDGQQSVFLKARSTASGDRFREGFGIEEFRFHADNDPELAAELSRSTPAGGPLFLLAAVAVALWTRRVTRS